MIYRVDLHVHSSATAEALSSLEELVHSARKAGLDAIAITDRDYCTPVPIEMRGVLLIPGCEVSTRGGDILGVFLEKPLDLVRLRENGLPTADEAVIEIHRCGGLAILAHPFAEKDADPALFPIRPDAVESISARAALKRADANELALVWATEHRRPQTGGSCAYSCHEVGNAYTEMACRRLSRACLKEALDLGHCRSVAVRNTDKTTYGYVDLRRAQRAHQVQSALSGAAGAAGSGLSRLTHWISRGKKKPQNVPPRRLPPKK